MKYEVVVPYRIEIELKKHLKSRELIRRFYKKLRKLEIYPTVYGKPLRKPLSGIWEIYFEKKWRVLFEIHEKDKTAVIIGFKRELSTTKVVGFLSHRCILC